MVYLGSRKQTGNYLGIVEEAVSNIPRFKTTVLVLNQVHLGGNINK